MLKGVNTTETSRNNDYIINSDLCDENTDVTVYTTNTAFNNMVSKVIDHFYNEQDLKIAEELKDCLDIGNNVIICRAIDDTGGESHEQSRGESHDQSHDQPQNNSSKQDEIVPAGNQNTNSNSRKKPSSSNSSFSSSDEDTSPVNSIINSARSIDENFVESNYFCVIIDNFCNSLIAFAMSIKEPTDSISGIIHKKTTRNKQFDNYILTVENFNQIMFNVIVLLKAVIISLNRLFVFKQVVNLVDFMENLRRFLQFLLDEKIFIKLNVIRQELAIKYKRDTDILRKITTIKKLVFHIINISIDITTIIIPQLTLLKDITTAIGEKIDEELEDENFTLTTLNFNMDDIIKRLLDIQLRGDIIMSFESASILEYLNDRNARTLIRTIENLQTEYVELSYTMSLLRGEIDSYKTKKKSFILIVLEKLKL
jgi:hypothetical protein